jgi:hypothetical protein
MFSCSHFFSGDRAKNDQLRVLDKFRKQLNRAAMHASSNLPSMRTKEWGH